MFREHRLLPNSAKNSLVSFLVTFVSSCTCLHLISLTFRYFPNKKDRAILKRTGRLFCILTSKTMKFTATYQLMMKIYLVFELLLSIYKQNVPEYH